MLKVLTAAVALLSFASVTNAQTNISSQIRSNTTWTKTGSPYIITGSLDIAPNVTLTLEPGTKVILESDIHLYGNLITIGTPTDSIYIISNKASTKSYLNFYTPTGDTQKFEYCHIENCSIGSSINKMISFRKSFIHDAVISYSFTENGYLNVEQCKLSWVHLLTQWGNDINLINNNLTQSYFRIDDNNKTTKIIGNKISDSPWWGIFSERSNLTIEDNTISGCSDNALMLQSCYDSKINNNTIINNKSAGIYIRKSNLSEPLSENIIAKNKTGIEIFHDVNGAISSNSIYENETGIEIKAIIAGASKSDVEIHNNCIYSNTDMNIRNSSTFMYDIEENWWGTTDNKIAEAKIYDYNDDFKVGSLNHMPILLQANQSCKTHTPPTSIPGISNNKSDITVYPNPFDNSLKITANSPIKHISIYNIVGKQVTDMNVNTIKEITINTQHYPTGIYIYNATLDNGQKVSGRIVKN